MDIGLGLNVCEIYMVYGGEVGLSDSVYLSLILCVTYRLTFVWLSNLVSVGVCNISDVNLACNC